MDHCGAGKMVEWLRALAALPEDPSLNKKASLKKEAGEMAQRSASVLNTHTVAHLNSTSTDSMPSSNFHGHQAHTDMYRQNIHTQKIKINL